LILTFNLCQPRTPLGPRDGNLVFTTIINWMKNPVTVLGRAQDGTRFRAVCFNVFYDSAPGEVTAAVEQAFQEDPPADVAKTPAPYCALKDFQPNCAVYELRYYLSDLSRPGATDSAVRSKIFYALSRAGIKLSVHSRSLVLSEAANQASERGAQAELDKRLAALRGVDVFEPLNDGERRILAGRLKPTPFAAGETITRQGALADWLYILYSGSAEVRLYSGDAGAYKTVKRLGPGDVLGEMGLLTGEPRTATAVAAEEVRCYRLDRDGFSGVLTSRPEIAQSIAFMLAKRRVELAAAREKLDGEAAAGLKREEQNLLSKIRSFFKL